MVETLRGRTSWDIFWSLSECALEMNSGTLTPFLTSIFQQWDEWFCFATRFHHDALLCHRHKSNGANKSQAEASKTMSQYKAFLFPSWLPQVFAIVSEIWWAQEMLTIQENYSTHLERGTGSDRQQNEIFLKKHLKVWWLTGYARKENDSTALLTWEKQLLKLTWGGREVVKKDEFRNTSVNASQHPIYSQVT